MKYSWLVSLFLLSSLTLLANEPARVCVTEFNEDGPKNPDLNWVGPSMKEAIEIALEEKFIFQKVDCNLNEDSLSNGGLSLKTKNLDLLLTGSYSSVQGRQLKLSARIYNRYQKNSKELPPIQKKIDNRIFTVTDQISNEIIVTLQDMAAQAETKPESEQDKPEKQTLVLKKEDNNAEADSFQTHSDLMLTVMGNVGLGVARLEWAWANSEIYQHRLLTSQLGLGIELFGFFSRLSLEASTVDRPSGSPQITGIDFNNSGVFVEPANGGGGHPVDIAYDLGYHFYPDWWLGAIIGVGVSGQASRFSMYSDFSIEIPMQIGLILEYRQYWKMFKIPFFVSITIRRFGSDGEIRINQAQVSDSFCIGDPACAHTANKAEHNTLQLFTGFFEPSLGLHLSMGIIVKEAYFNLTYPSTGPQSVTDFSTALKTFRLRAEKQFHL